MGLKEVALFLIAFAIGCGFNSMYPQVGAGLIGRIPVLGKRPE